MYSREEQGFDELLVGDYREGQARSSRSRSLAVFKTLVLLALVAATLYGLLNRGLFGLERWLPVALGILGLLFVVLFVRGYFRDVPRVGWVLVALMGVLVAVKGLSLTWSISQYETVKELLRSSTYLSVFVLALASFASRRLAGPFVDGMVLLAGAVAGYGVLQKVRPVEYPSNTSDGVRVGSTIEYANTTAAVVGMGLALGLARMTQLRNPVARGLYAALLLVFGAILYLTFSRGGMASLAVGLLALFVVGERRLQAFANLLLLALPLGWLLWRVQRFDTFFAFSGNDALRAAEGTAFRADLVLAVVVAFVLQALYAALVERYELAPGLHRVLGAASVALVLAGTAFVGYAFVSAQEDSGGVAGASS